MYTKACVNKRPTNLNIVFYTSQRTCTYKFLFDALKIVRTFILYKRKFSLCATEQLTQGYTVKLTGAEAAKSLQSCQTLCDSIDGSPPGSPIPGILQARTLEWVAISFSAAATAKSLQSCPTLCDPIDGSPPGSPVPGILQARTLEWVATSFSTVLHLREKICFPFTF